MKTDDLFADLGTQLRDARPRRDVRSLAAFALLAILLVAALALALVPRDPERPAPTTPAAAPRVAVLNGTQSSGLAGGTAELLRRSGYRVDAISNTAQPVGPTSVTAADPRYEGAARRIGALVGATDTAVRPVTEDADIVVVLGFERAKRPRVLIVNASSRRGYADEVAARLRDHGIVVVETARIDQRYRTLVTPRAADLGPAVASALGFEDYLQPVAQVLDGSPVNVAIRLGDDELFAARLERRLPRTECTPGDRAGHFDCEIRDRRYTVRVDGPCFEAEPLAAGRRIRGCFSR